MQWWRKIKAKWQLVQLHKRVIQLYEQVQYPQAIDVAIQVLDLTRQYVGKNHPGYAANLNYLAGLYHDMGHFTQAESLFRQALEIYKKVLGENHPECADTLNSLAGLYRGMGYFTQAESLFRQALEIYKKVLGENHSQYAGTLSNLAGLYEGMGHFTQAEPLYWQALEICKKVLGENHPYYAGILHNLAGAYEKMGHFTQAESLLQQALQICKKVLGENHRQYAGTLNRLATLYRRMGHFTQAEPPCRQALEIYKKVLGEDHPKCADTLNSLAVLYVATARETEALTLMKQAASINDRMIGQIFSIGSESQRAAYLKTIEGNFNGFSSLVSQHLSASPTAVHAALDLVLRRKAIGAEALAAQRDAVLGGQYPELEPKLRELTTWRMQITQKKLAGPGPEGLAVHQQQLADWDAHKERLEADLARRIPEMNLERKLREADRQAVARAMPAGVALIEVVRFRVFDFKAVPARGEQQRQPAHYLAFVIPAGEPDHVQMVDLGEAEPIDRLIATFRQAIIQEGMSRGIKLPPKPAPASVIEGRKLRAAVFDRLTDALGGCQRLLLAPDGDLTRLPFEVLPLDDGHRLMDAYHISYLSSGRDVLRFGMASSGQPTAAVVAADPDFDLASVTTAAPIEVQVSLGQASHFASSRQSRDLDRADLHFKRLPGTGIEGERIAAMLEVEPWLDRTALEARLKACRSPRILHLATHGFFLGNQVYDLNKVFQAHGLQVSLSVSESERRLLALPGMENPMLRSGMALAGANTGRKKGPLPPEAEDGLLTAEDVSGLNLLSTELVVLSACETGLGETHTGEGVFGLRRAFVLAGAKTLVMSLWKVPDLATAILMERFYNNLLHRGLARDEALRDAQINLRGVTLGEIRASWLSAEMIERLSAGDKEVKEKLEELARQPDDHQPFNHPYFWGAFICQGDPAPMPQSGVGSL